MTPRRFLLVDLSNNNLVHDLTHARAAGICGCWLKVTEGDTFVDGEYQRIRKLALAAGLRVGGYHFARVIPGHAPEQALRFAGALGKIGRRDLRPVLDIETDDGHLAGEGLGTWAQTFLQTFRKRTGVGCMVYSYSSFLASMRLRQPIGYGLWLAGYGSNDGSEHPATVPAPWKHASAHQFTSRGHLAGVAGEVDLTSAPRLRPLLAHGVFGL